MQPVSENAARCPHCGNPQVRSHRKQILLAVASAMFLALLATVFFIVRHASNPQSADPDAPAAVTPEKTPPLNN